MSDEATRLLGVMAGYTHAIVTVGALRGRITGPRDSYLPPKRHTRLRAAAMARVAELDKAIELLRRDFAKVKRAYEEASS